MGDHPLESHAVNPRPSAFVIVLILGALATLSPIAIDLYLPAFPQIAAQFGTSPSRIAFSLSSYFIGLSLGQLFYGPLLDRYGRKRPLYAGLTIFALASLGCMWSSSVESLVALRFLQALGGCAASVAATAMVRDFFPPAQGAKIFSLLILILSVSPLLAPTIGGLISTTFGWPFTFLLLALAAAFLITIIFLFLPEGHEPDPQISLGLRAALRTYWRILKEPQFFAYAVSGAFAFSGLFAYVAGSPILFMDVFQLTPERYGATFATISIGLIGAAQLNILLMKRFRSEQIFLAAAFAQTAIGFLLLIGNLNGGFALLPTVALLFAFLSSLGFNSPNASGLALAPFSQNAGSASALLGFLQIGLGALASGVVGLFNSRSALPIMATLAGTALVGLLVLLWGRGRIVAPVEASETISVGH